MDGKIGELKDEIEKYKVEIGKLRKEVNAEIELIEARAEKHRLDGELTLTKRLNRKRITEDEFYDALDDLDVEKKQEIDRGMEKLETESKKRAAEMETGSNVEPPSKMPKTESALKEIVKEIEEDKSKREDKSKSSIDELYTYDKGSFTINELFLSFEKGRSILEHSSEFCVGIIDKLKENTIVRIHNASGMGKTTFALIFIHRLVALGFTVVASHFMDKNTFVFTSSGYKNLEDGSVDLRHVREEDKVIRLIDSPVNVSQYLPFTCPSIAFLSESKYNSMSGGTMLESSRVDLVFPAITFPTFENIVKSNIAMIKDVDDVIEIAFEYGAIKKIDCDVDTIAKAFWFVFGPKPRVLFDKTVRNNTMKKLMTGKSTDERGNEKKKSLSNSHAFCYYGTDGNSFFFSEFARIKSALKSWTKFREELDKAHGKQGDGELFERNFLDMLVRPDEVKSNKSASWKLNLGELGADGNVLEESKSDPQLKNVIFEREQTFVELEGIKPIEKDVSYVSLQKNQESYESFGIIGNNVLFFQVTIGDKHKVWNEFKIKKVMDMIKDGDKLTACYVWVTAAKDVNVRKVPKQSKSLRSGDTFVGVRKVIHIDLASNLWNYYFN